ncbi:WD repeat-containing protein 3-like [Trifolium medium]|uniref:WD repeat-containing protein 3-like n=1 Tax=Trifolium medium TaxID=97028 RepID=A0A392PTC5_9FABA|nr:WD repeat-containing protein 3-like [Trifolium medium]
MSMQALPFTDALKLLSYLKEWTSYSDKVELVCRIGALLLQTHYNQLLSTPAARPVLTAFSDIFYERVKAGSVNRTSQSRIQLI